MGDDLRFYCVVAKGDCNKGCEFYSSCDEKDFPTRAELLTNQEALEAARLFTPAENAKVKWEALMVRAKKLRKSKKRGKK